MNFKARSLLFMAAATAGACATTGVPAGGGASPSKEAPATPQFLAANFERATIADLDKAFGAPALTRVEGPGEFRRYMLDACALLVILYPDENGERRVTKLDAGALRSGEEATTLDECLAVGKTR
ncbi:MAG: hypothetical protein U5J99_14200 [Parvularculaceae bacterium]|nr:hypothetical protein [Parvularculaceae bacterium]